MEEEDEEEEGEGTPAAPSRARQLHESTQRAAAVAAAGISRAAALCRTRVVTAARLELTRCGCRTPGLLSGTSTARTSSLQPQRPPEHRSSPC
jgi:hypothetical protein